MSVQLHNSLGMRVLVFFGVRHRRLVEDEYHCHRLMSRFPSQLLPALWSALLLVLWKKGCLRAAARVRRFVGSYSSMASIRSNSWWCSSASDRRYLCERERMKIIVQYINIIYTHTHKPVCYLPVKVCSFLWRIFLLKSSRPSPGVHDKSISVSCAV